MKKSFYFLVIISVIVLLIPQIFAGYSWEKIGISRVLDSNHLVLKNSEKVWRIIGLKENDEFSADKQEACHASENFREIKNLLLNNEVFSATDEKVHDALHLKIGKEYVTEIILRNGWAKMNTDEVSSFFSARFKKAQEYAKNKKLGIWDKCLLDKNWAKIRENFGERMKKLKRKYPQFLGQVAVGEVAEVLSGNELRLKNGPIVQLANVKIPRENNQASHCFRENSRNYLENLVLGKKIRLEKPLKSREISNYKLVRNVFILNPTYSLPTQKMKSGRKFRGIFVNEKMIKDGFGKFIRTAINLDQTESNLEKTQKEVYKNPRGAWAICAREILQTPVENPAKKEKIREVDENCPIKGNISGTKANPIKTYHTVLSGWYDRIQPEQCFQTEEEANLAGFRKIK